MSEVSAFGVVHDSPVSKKLSAKGVEQSVKAFDRRFAEVANKVAKPITPHLDRAAPYGSKRYAVLSFPKDVNGAARKAQYRSSRKAREIKAALKQPVHVRRGGVSKSMKLLVRAGGSRGAEVPKKTAKADAVRRKAPPHWGKIKTEVSKVVRVSQPKPTVGHKLRKLAHKLESPWRKEARSAIRRGRAKPPSKQRLKELDDIAVHHQAMSNPTSAEVARRAKQAHGTYHYDKSGPLRPHEPKPTGEQAKKIALSRANMSLRHYGPLTPVTKRFWR